MKIIDEREKQQKRKSTKTEKNKRLTQARVKV